MFVKNFGIFAHSCQFWIVSANVSGIRVSFNILSSGSSVSSSVAPPINSVGSLGTGIGGGYCHTPTSRATAGGGGSGGGSGTGGVPSAVLYFTIIY